ncbi:VOC family protein [Hyphococcus sp.]|jgi:PhnB protein|uniref:VOC family protein n=1 Tax=Hyphococcus sp. TaxID=2038636 RepID=UPI003D1250D1
MMRLNHYLHFLGQCEEALTLYQRVLGGEITAMMKVKGSPAEGHYGHDGANDVLHGCLSLEGCDIMASDAPKQFYTKPNGAHICIVLDNEDEAERIFNALSDGGEIAMPFEATFFAKKYAMFNDRFGTRWMIHCA